MENKCSILFNLYRRLQRGPCSVDILRQWKEQQGYHFSDRTLYRYIAELRSALESSEEDLVEVIGEKNKQTWKIVQQKPEEMLNLFDMNAYYLFKNFIPRSIYAGRRSSFEKIERTLFAQLGDNKFEKLAEAGELHYLTSDFYDMGYTEAEHKELEHVIWAVQNSRKIQILPVNTGESSSAFPDNIEAPDVLLPLKLVFHRGLIHIAVYNESAGKTQLIPFDKNYRIELTNDVFNRKKFETQMKDFAETHFGITDNIDNEVYDIELEFSSRTGAFVKEIKWHPSQKITRLQNGNWHFTMRCGINRELAGWIFQWMSNVKVVAPVLLKEMIINKHQHCLRVLTGEEELMYNNTFADYNKEV
jgi:predicted DNA-binding transcriptional regulator YafY